MNSVHRIVMSYTCHKNIPTVPTGLGMEWPILPDDKVYIRKSYTPY